jgi:hypothetical protein
MPELINPLPVAKSQNLISICEIIAFDYATTILTTETPWTNYDGSTVAFDKRISLAKEIINTKGKNHGSILAYLVSSDYPNISADNRDNYVYLQSLDLFKMPYELGNNFNSSPVSKYDARQIWNILANVTVDECTE